TFLRSLRVALLLRLCAAFNLDEQQRVVFSGQRGSYFGYSVEFFNNSSSFSILIGAPKANTSQPDIVEGGAVYLCPWSQTNCSIVNFDTEGDRYFYINDVNTQVEFKSRQWFGATVRSHGNRILACAPRYYWRTEHNTPFADVTGTCFLSVDSLETFVEFAPCRTERHGPAGQGYCQGGFSADFTKDGRVVLGGPGSFYWQGQLISATTEEIVKAYYPSYFLLSVDGQIQTRQVEGSYDDSYLGELLWAVSFLVLLLTNFFHLKSRWSNFHVSNVFQMGSYFGYAVAATDINNDGLDDLLVGAPMFMRQGSSGRLEELGKVYVYLQKGPLLLEPSQSHLMGKQAYGRFGSSLAPLGDLNQDGFNDVAIGCPYGGDDQQGLVLIYNGRSGGLMDTPTQTLSGQWAFSSFPANFGFALRGNTDLDHNGYPDLIVGAFGVDKAVLYRARPIVSVSASLTVQPTLFNQEEKTCELLTGTGPICALCFVCEAFVVELQLDSVKPSQKESVRRTLFLDSQQPSLLKNFSLSDGGRSCHDTQIYLRAEDEFRDKLSPIYVSLNFSLDPQATSAPSFPCLHLSLPFACFQVQIQLDCGEDNICVPDLKLAVYGDRSEVYLGEENAVTLTFNARNEGEGGAYEAELYVALPSEADYSGILRNNGNFTQLTCSYEAENQTRYLVCDLGNPMKSGTSLWAGFRFTVPRLRDTYKTVMFELQIRRGEAAFPKHHLIIVAVVTGPSCLSVSHPDKLFFPPPNWSLSQSLREEQDIGPELQQIYELVNNGPSAFSQATLEVRCPLRAQGHPLLYPVEVVTEGPLSCSSKHLNTLKLKVRTLRRASEIRSLLIIYPFIQLYSLKTSRSSVILKVRSRVWAETFIEVSGLARVHGALAGGLRAPSRLPMERNHNRCHWHQHFLLFFVPVWIIILAVLAGLLLLALLIYLLYKVKRLNASASDG
uniref:Integrin subunit alpha 5 n=1 Tax=Takifugu rubripes TaxID=31033 RepID=H2RJQ9_TAKRU